MPSNLKDITREFARGVVTLGAWRAAAQAEAADQRLADAILKTITSWENTRWPDMGRARTELRERAEQLVPPAPMQSEESKRKQDPTTAMYEAGLRGQRRHI